MSQDWQSPAETRIVSNETVPARLFACFAQVNPEAGAALDKTYATGENPPEELSDLHQQHLLHTHRLGETGSIWEAGPSAGFKQILYIYSCQDLDSAKQLMHGDPFYRAGLFANDWWMKWSVHTPYWKTGQPIRGMIEGLMRGIGVLPSYPPDLNPAIKVINEEMSNDSQDEIRKNSATRSDRESANQEPDSKDLWWCGRCNGHQQGLS